MDWLIHIGAHKTATTHIQDSLSVASSQLSESGIFFLSREKSRPILRQGLIWSVRPRRYYINIYLLRHKLTHLAHDQGCKSLLLSEENLLGGAADSLKSPLYPNAQIGISFLNQIKRKDNLKIFLCIRGFDAVAPGAYATGLRFKNVTTEDKKKYIEKVKNQPPRWVNLIERLLRALASNTELKVWRYEDYQKNRDLVLESLVSNAASKIPNLPPPQETATPTKEGVLIAESFLQRKNTKYSGSKWTTEVDKIYAQNLAKSKTDKFNFLDSECIEILNNAYNADCKEILERWPSIALYS